jgi:hypothetical protein
MPDFKKWLAKRKREKQRENIAEAAFEKSGRTKDVPVDDPISDKRLSEAKKRRKKFSKKVESEQSAEKLKKGFGGSYELKGGIDEPGRKGKKRSIKRARSKQYIVPADKPKSIKLETPGTPGTKIMHQTTVGGEYPGIKGTDVPGLKKDDASRLKSTDWKEATGKEMRAKVSKSIKDAKESQSGKKITIPESKEEKKLRRADKVALIDPDYTIATKSKEVRKRGGRKPFKIKKKVVKELLPSKDYKGAIGTQKRSRDREEEKVKGGGTKVTITKVRKGGDKTITKTTTKIPRKKSDTFYRQEKPLSKRKKRREKAGK